MKKLFFVAIILALTSQSFAQSNPTYIVFTPTKQNDARVEVRINTNYNTNLYRHAPRGYTFINRTLEYWLELNYLSWNDQPDNPIISKPSSFLNTVQYIDWDVIGPTLTKAQAEAKFKEILSHSPIYMIDRSEIRNNTIMMVPVRKLESAY